MMTRMACKEAMREFCFTSLFFRCASTTATSGNAVIPYEDFYYSSSRIELRERRLPAKNRME
jgi:hypothetical protein